MFDRVLVGLSRVAAAGGRSTQTTRRRWLAPALVVVLVLAWAAVANGLSSPARPVLKHHGETLRWTPVGRRRVYLLMTTMPGGRHVVTVTRHTRLRPRPRPGTTVVYRVRAAYNESRWSNPVTIRYPALASGADVPPAAQGTGGAAAPSGLITATSEELAREGSLPEALPGHMAVGVSAGGWGPSAWPDVAGAAKYVRMSSHDATDAEVGGAAAAGVSVASWLFGQSGSIGSMNASTYAAEIVSVFKHYGRGGTFWAGKKRDLGSRAVEVLNEPGNPGFWRDPTNYAAYVTLLRTVHEALAANFPESIRPRVLASWDGGEGPSSAFGPGWKALGGLAYVDGVTVHPYGGKSGGDGGALGGREDVEQAHAATGLPVYVTEVGWPTAVGQPSTGDSQQWTEAQQAENITNFVRWARSTEYVATVLVFNFVDYGSNTWYGIERSDRSHKPSYAALANA